jgi:hypothetical protein
MVTGDVVNRFATAERRSGERDRCGEMTYRSTRDFIDYEELEPVTVKGKPQPVALWRALSARSRFGIDTELAPKAGFVGRDMN